MSKQSITERSHGFTPQAVARMLSRQDVGAWTVYAITDGHAVKIGKCKGHPKERLDHLQTGNLSRLYLLAYTTTVTENVVHRVLASERMRGEWFRLSAKVLQMIGSWEWLHQDLLDKLSRTKR